MQLLFFLLSSLFLSSPLWCTTPVPYSGKVSVNGVNFEGTGKFAFSLYDLKEITHWRNGAKKDKTITVNVVNGRYTVLLGGQGMNALPPEIFLNHDELYLKVRFDQGDGKGFRHLTPDQRITAAPLALVAEVAKVAKFAESAKVADSVKEGGVAASQMKNNTITTAQLNEQILKYLKPEITSPLKLLLHRKNIYTGQPLTILGHADGKYLSYQWYRNGKIIDGAKSKNLEITNMNANNHNGSYSLTVRNDFGSISTQNVRVEVNSTRLYHTVPSVSNMEMIWVEPGTFTMGQKGYENNHEVTLSHGYYLGKFEVTQAQYREVMKNNSQNLNPEPSRRSNHDNRPVEKVSWEDIQVFLLRLNQAEQNASRLPLGWKYVLPTEAQWEYACRANTTTLYSWGNDINSSHANYNWDENATNGGDANETVDVGQNNANSWGFFDMHGNVWEWVHDWHSSYPSNPQTDPAGPASGSNRVLRGGSWSNDGTALRSARRTIHAPSTRSYSIGFRVGFQKIQSDTAKPELELLGGASTTHTSGQVWAEPGVAAHDVRDGNLTHSVKINGSVDINKTGTYKLTYSVSDAAGNQATAERVVTVVSNDLTFVAEISAYSPNKSVFETRNLKPFYESTITADNNSSAVHFDSWWRDESENPNRPWSETNKADLEGTMKQTFPSMTSFSIEKFSDSNVKETINASIEWYNWYHMPKFFKFSQEIFTDAFKQKFPEGTKVRITYSAN